MEHVWIQNEIDWGLIRDEYETEGCKVVWQGTVAKYMEATYFGYPVIVRFYTADQVNKHVQLGSFCGVQLQKVVFMEQVAEQPCMYLLSRMRSKVLPNLLTLEPVKGSYLGYEIVEDEAGIVWSDGNGDNFLPVSYGGTTQEEIEEVIQDAMW